MTTRKIVTFNSDAKTRKGRSLKWLTGIHYGAHSTSSGVANMCPDATPGCIRSCLTTAGRASFDPAITTARIFRTIMFVQRKPEFWRQTIKDVQALRRKAAREELRPCVRMNGVTDLPWERIRIKGTGTQYDGLTLMEAFPDVQWYDYTKTIDRIGKTPANYYLLASWSEHMTESTLHGLASDGYNVAVVFRVCDHKGTCKCQLPTNWFGVKVIDGDKSDVRFLDPSGVIVGLKAKGDARNDTSGFVINARRN